MSGNLTIWNYSVQPTPGKAALVIFYSMNGLITKFRTKVIDKNQVNQLLYASSYEGKQSKPESNSSIFKDFV